jgi:hypothetical protein
MKARLLIINPEAANQPPAAPTLVVQDDEIGLYTAGHWSRSIARDSLEAVTVEDIRGLLHIPAEDKVTVYLTPVRSLPTEDLWSDDLYPWVRKWWTQTVAELMQKELLVQAS